MIVRSSYFQTDCLAEVVIYQKKGLYLPIHTLMLA